MRGARHLFSLVLILTFGLASSAAAQVPDAQSEAPTDEDVERARDLFTRGLTYIDDARWADALDVFRTCYELTGNSVALYNVALSLRALGRNVESKAAFDALETRHGDELPEDLRPVAAEMRQEVAERIAILELLAIPSDAPPLTIRLDGRVVPTDGPPWEIEADEGERRLLVESVTQGRYAWEGRLHPGQRLPLDVELEAESSGVPWWIFVGAGVLVAAGVLIAVLVLTAPEAPQFDSMVEL